MTSMKIAVTGATGVIGAAAVRSLVAEGHRVVGLARTPDKASLLESWGATAQAAGIFDHPSLVAMFDGCDAVCNFATHIPVGLRAARASAWRENDLLRTEGVRRVVAAAQEARVRRLVQESVSFLYADQGEDWIDEQSPLDINVATEPACVGESHVQAFQSDLRQGVVLRFGLIVGDDAQTRFWLRNARRGRPVGMGSPEGWVHLVHTDDLGPAVAAALTAPGGTYNLGAEPVRRRDLVRGLGEAAGRDSGAFMPPLLRRALGARVEPLTRSLRVSSSRFSTCTGWTPRRPVFDPGWLAATRMSRAGR